VARAANGSVFGADHWHRWTDLGFSNPNPNPQFYFKIQIWWTDSSKSSLNLKFYQLCSLSLDRSWFCVMWLKDQGEVSSTFLSCTFLKNARFGEKNFHRKSAKTKVVFFTANEMDSIFHHYRRRRLKKKLLQCKTIIKIKEIQSEHLAQKHEKSEFSNNFQTTFRNTYVHIFYVTVFVISCRFHICQNWRDLEQNIRYGFMHR